MLGRVLQRTRPVVRAIRCRTGPAVVLTHRYSTTPAGSSEEGARDPFSANPIPPDLMKVLVCPLSKEPLRHVIFMQCRGQHAVPSSNPISWIVEYYYSTICANINPILYVRRNTESGATCSPQKDPPASSRHTNFVAANLVCG